MQLVPVERAGEMTLLYPQWLPGYHAPRSAIELLAGLVIRAGDEVLSWRRHPTEVHAFSVEVPERCGANWSSSSSLSNRQFARSRDRQSRSAEPAVEHGRALSSGLLRPADHDRAQADAAGRMGLRLRSRGREA